jgi:hypothetical protein
MPDQKTGEKEDPERRWLRAKTIAAIADVVVRLLETFLRR